jgi:hypothetical protein
MKTLLALFLLTAGTALAESPFPGLKIVMTPEEFARAGLSTLTPDQLGVIDAAIIRHYVRTVATAANQQAEQISQQTMTEEHKKGWLSRFGLPDISLSQDWRNETGLKAHCTGWVTGNSFKLDNGQVWEGWETITVEVANRDIEIQPRPGGLFALVVDGKNTTVRVHRVK